MELITEDKKIVDKREANKIRCKLYRTKNAESIKIKKKKYYLEHADHFKTNARNRWKEKSEDIKIYQKRYYLKNSTDVIEKQKNYNIKNTESVKKYQRKYRLEHKESAKTYHREYNRNKQKTDPIYRMMKSLRSRLHKALENQGVKKDIHSKKLFGADQEFVWKHLESLFNSGMARENYGFKGWHIDHIKPMSAFDLSDPEQLKECCHYKNLQPLWWYDNLSKGKNYGNKK